LLGVNKCDEKKDEIIDFLIAYYYILFLPFGITFIIDKTGIEKLS
jgi:hypothetical protein